MQGASLCFQYKQSGSGKYKRHITVVTENVMKNMVFLWYLVCFGVLQKWEWFLIGITKGWSYVTPKLLFTQFSPITFGQIGSRINYVFNLENVLQIKNRIGIEIGRSRTHCSCCSTLVCSVLVGVQRTRINFQRLHSNQGSSNLGCILLKRLLLAQSVKQKMSFM